MEFLYDPATPAQAGAVTLILLPGANIRPEDFFEQGFVAALKRPVSAVPVRAHVGYYLDDTLVETLENDVLAPLRSRGHSRFWLAGISLGGFGALSFLRARRHAVEGALLLSPFLATTGVITEVTRAGGLDRWDAEATCGDRERQFIAWLKALSADSLVLRQTFLGCGRSDRFVAASTLLAQRLPAGRVVSAEGGHDWQTWRSLWQLLLDLDPFAPCP